MADLRAFGGRGFGEDVRAHGVMEEAPEKFLGKRSLGGEGGVGYASIGGKEWDKGGDGVGVDCAEREEVSPLVKC